MAINLQKGQRISLAKEAPGLSRLMCGLGWDVAGDRYWGLGRVFGNEVDFDLDASIFCLNAEGRVPGWADIIYYGNLRHPSGAIVHGGDNLTGEGKGDDEQIFIDLSKIPQEIVRLTITVNIYDCRARSQDFQQVKNAFVRLVDFQTKKELARYNLSGEAYSGMTGMMMAQIYRSPSGWQLEAMGKGLQVDGLDAISRTFG
ncbi:TerD family protein [Oscillatoriales cyanobacterium LEGE 11467]|uniref:TerD family protein n=1 Tax=Zarconia navalis LEGE 11467 TaxID=1828826 RepID=A0A928Z739_9CYAN|nr:TerD family protein [Zarconia navalis]MBE9039278.1 TerD family protein [Zarconia navalis LEGE 11467]